MSATSQAGSAVGQAVSASSTSWPSRCQSSSARCGIIGPSSRTSVSSASRSSAGAAASRSSNASSRVRQLADQRHRLVEVEAVELVGDRGDRAVDRALELERRGRRAGSAPACPTAASRGARLVDQPPQPVQIAPGAVDAGLGPLEVALGRAVGQHEQARGVGAVGLDDLGRIDRVALGLAHLLDAADGHRPAVADARRQCPVLALADLVGLEPVAVPRRGRSRGVTMPWVNRPANGSSRSTDSRISRSARVKKRAVEQVQHRVLDAADILVDRQPVVGGSARRTAASACGEQKRAKYQELSTKVSKVSVSRRAGPPAARAGDVLPGRVTVERVARPAEARRPRAARPAAARAAPARCRRPRSGSPGSGSPSSAGARRPSRAGGR